LITLFSNHFSAVDLMIFYLVALFIGMAKTGVHGAGMIAVPLLAGVFGGRTSSGVLLPMLVFADLMGVQYYHQHASWKHLKILFPWAAGGVIAGAIVGKILSAGFMISINDIASISWAHIEAGFILCLRM